jgi:ATP-binding cassette subfamily F protein 3
VTEFAGSLDDYPDWLAAREREQTPESAVAQNSAASRKAKKQREAEERLLLAPLRKRMQKAERQLDSLQSARSALEHKLADTSLYESANKASLQELLATQAETARQLEHAEMEWLQCCEELEQAQSE